MTRFKVYLAGAISGLAFDDAQDWRAYVRGALEPTGIDAYSPLRQKHFLENVGPIDPNGSYGVWPLSTDRGIMTRDHFDCQSSDLIFVNLLGATRVSIGTVMEIAWAFAYRKPLVMAMEDGNLHDHPMIREAIGYRVPTLDHAIAVTQAILLPHTVDK